MDSQTYIKDLQKLKDQELYFIICLFRYELESFNRFDGFQLKGLIIACNNMKNLIKDFRFILNSYIPLATQTDIEELLSDIHNIENYLNKIKKVRLLKTKVNELADICLLKMQILYDSLSDFIYGEYYFCTS